MHSILFIADGEMAAAVAESALMREHAVIARTSSATEALMLLNEEPFDAIVCAIDELSEPARDCLSAIKGEETPTVIVTSRIDIPVQSFDINTRVVSIDEGALAVSTAIRQQLRRVETRPVTRRSAGFEFEFKFRAEPCRIGRARAIAGGFVQRCTQIDEQELTRLELALEAALSNAVLHGSLELDTGLLDSNPDAYQQQLVDRLTDPAYCERQVEVKLVFEEDLLTLTVTDVGSGFDVPTVLASVTPGAIARGGRGLLTMHAFADHVEVNDIGNSITLTRRIGERSSQTSEPVSADCIGDIVKIPALHENNETLAGRT